MTPKPAGESDEQLTRYQFVTLAEPVRKLLMSSGAESMDATKSAGLIVEALTPALVALKAADRKAAQKREIEARIEEARMAEALMRSPLAYTDQLNATSARIAELRQQLNEGEEIEDGE